MTQHGEIQTARPELSLLLTMTEADLQLAAGAMGTRLLIAELDAQRAALAASRESMRLLIETTTRLSCGHDGCYGESAIDAGGTWRFLHCWQCRAEAAEAALERTQAEREAL